MMVANEVKTKAQQAKTASRQMISLSTAQKNEALLQMADALITRRDEIIAANKEDLRRGKESGLRSSLLDRLALDNERIEAMAVGLRQIVELPDPIGETLETIERPNGLHVERRRVPLGLIGIIYEARPNVTVDAAGLCLKSGNAVLLRGGSSAIHSNTKIVEVLHGALAHSALPAAALQLVENTDRATVDEMLKLNDLIDIIIPRGGASLIQNVIQNATVPVIETGAGICHTYLDRDANLEMAKEIAINAKVQRPSVCNAMETLLVHEQIAADCLPALAEKFRAAGVELRGCAKAKALIPDINEASEDDWATEYNDYILNIKVTSGMSEALAHIQQYGTMHSECIVTENQERADRFLREVDAAAVYHNASTRFTDGFEFGFGAEIGISTQKLHARGPMGLPALTSSKFYVLGNGQIRS